jgi:hypothetical protein
MNQVTCEPPQGKGRCVAAAEKYRARAHQIIDSRAVGLCHKVLLKPCAVRSSEPRLICVDLHCHRNASQWAGVLAASYRLVNAFCLCQHQFWPVFHNRIDLRVDCIESLERGRRSLTGGDIARTNEVGEFSRGQTPEFSHSASDTARLVSVS